MPRFTPGQVVAFNFDDGSPPGLARARVVRATREIVTGQLYRIEIMGIIRPSSWTPPVRPPRVGSQREVVERHLSVPA